jgi:hypothetical protein
MMGAYLPLLDATTLAAYTPFMVGDVRALGGFVDQLVVSRAGISQSAFMPALATKPSAAVSPRVGPTVESAEFAANNRVLGYTFRGDTRPPEEIFANGFSARGDSTDILAHALDNRSPPSAFIPTTKSEAVAAEFADKIYIVRPKGGIDVNAVLGLRSPFPNELEVAVPWRIAPWDIRAVTLHQRGVSILNPSWKP